MSASPGSRLRLAVPNKGRLAAPALGLLRETGLAFEADDRHLFAPCRNFPLDLLFVRGDDVAEYVQDGVVDLGIAGTNLLEETGARVRRGPRLGFGACRLQLAVPASGPLRQVEDLEGRQVATSHPRLTARFLEGRGVKARLIHVSGAVEVTPLLGVADAVTDLVATGSTMAINGLRLLDTILESEAELVLSTSSESSGSALADQLELMVASVIAAHRQKYLMLNAPAGSVATICQVIPGLGSPSVIPLADPGMVALHAVVDADRIWETLEPLRRAGASSILVLPIERLIP